MSVLLNGIEHLYLARASFQTKPTRPQELESWKQVLYKVALLAPKLLFSGAGWAIGFAVGGNIGAGVGDMIGTLVGCTLSLAIELAVRQFVLNDPDLHVWNLMKTRTKQAVILSAGSLVGGMIFNTALTKWASHLAFGNTHIFQALATGAITALTFASGMTAARGVYTTAHNIFTQCFRFEKDQDYDTLKLSWEHLKDDLQLSALIIFPAETAFVATSLPLLGSQWLMGSTLATFKAAGSVFIGGAMGSVISETASKIVSRCFSSQKTPA